MTSIGKTNGQPMQYDQLPTGPEGVSKYNLYKTLVGGTVWFAVRETDNPRGGGDSIFRTPEEAEKYAAQAKKRDEANAAYRAKEAAYHADQAKKKAASEDTDGFADQFSPRTKALVIKVLTKDAVVRGVLASVRDHVRTLVKEGKHLNQFEENKVKPMSRTRSFRASNEQQAEHAAKVARAGKKTTYLVGGYDLGKTAYDYARFLQGK